MTKKELLDIVAAAGYMVLKDTPVRNSDEPPYARHQLIIVKEEGTSLNRTMFNYLVKDDGSVFYMGSDPFAVKEPTVKTVFETKIEEHMATLKMMMRVRSSFSSSSKRLCTSSLVTRRLSGLAILVSSRTTSILWLASSRILAMFLAVVPNAGAHKAKWDAM